MNRITRLYTRSTNASALGIQICHLTIYLPGEADLSGDVTETGGVSWLWFAGQRADTDFTGHRRHIAYDGDDLFEEHTEPDQCQSLEGYLEDEHQKLTADGWSLLPHDFGISETTSRIIARSYELASHAKR
ncbi:hypothetical protein [Nonomuraea sp. NPDC050643]|uniref:hypothetical protein n=1 Tax=Nonomuraea sp. NPDC050643 TaxID=3155660 RepID=UPI0034069EF1